MKKRILGTILMAAVAVFSCTAGLDDFIGKTPLRVLDEKGDRYFTEVMKRSVYTWAVVRGLNGIISVIQGTDISISPVGVGVRLAVGEILDPVNDLMERFSWIMLLSISALGIQKIFMEIGQWIGFQWVLSAAAAVFALGIWIPGIHRFRLRPLAFYLAFFALVIRFSIPVMALASEKVYDVFLRDRYDQSIRSLERVNRNMNETVLFQKKAGSASPGFFDTLSGIFDMDDSLSMKEKLSRLKERISGYADYVIDLIIVFLIQTIVIPLLVLWGFFRLLSFMGSDLQRLPVRG